MSVNLVDDKVREYEAWYIDAHDKNEALKEIAKHILSHTCVGGCKSNNNFLKIIIFQRLLERIRDIPICLIPFTKEACRQRLYEQFPHGTIIAAFDNKHILELIASLENFVNQEGKEEN